MLPHGPSEDSEGLGGPNMSREEGGQCAQAGLSLMRGTSLEPQSPMCKQETWSLDKEGRLTRAPAGCDGRSRSLTSWKVVTGYVENEGLWEERQGSWFTVGFRLNT